MRNVLVFAVCGCLLLIAAAVAIAAGEDDNEDNQRTAAQSARAIGSFAAVENRFRVRSERSRDRRRVEGRRRRQRDRGLVLHRTPAGPAAQGGAAASTGGGSTAPAGLRSIAACESGGNYSAVGGGGMYRGAYQFTYATWASVGGSGDPAAASPAEQDRRAAMLYAQTGGSAWPNCGG